MKHRIAIQTLSTYIVISLSFQCCGFRISYFRVLLGKLYAEYSEPRVMTVLNCSCGLYVSDLPASSVGLLGHTACVQGSMGKGHGSPCVRQQWTCAVQLLAWTLCKSSIYGQGSLSTRFSPNGVAARSVRRAFQCLYALWMLSGDPSLDFLLSWPLLAFLQFTCLPWAVLEVR